MQWHGLAPAAEPCCLPTPYRISHYVAGMAFNFSRIEMAHQSGHRAQPEPTVEAATAGTPSERD